MPHGFTALTVVLTGLVATGCSSVTRFDGFSLRDDAVYVSGLPPVRQDRTYACGAACVAAVAATCGVGVDEFTSRLPHAEQDTTAEDLADMAEHLGLQAFAYRGSMDDLQSNLRDGRPVIVMIPMPFVGRGDFASTLVLDLWNQLGPRPSHWVVVLGLTGENRVILQDPASGPLTIARRDFERWWARRDNLCVLIAPKAPTTAATN